MELTLAIIGTAGRKEDAKRLDKNYFSAMCTVAGNLVDGLKEINYEVTTLVSGGAAWADHVAVRLFLEKKVPNLRLFIPCEFEGGMFSDKIAVRQPVEKGYTPAQTLNYFHKRFSLAINIHSLSDIQIAKNEGAEILPCKGGFYGRNAMVAKSNIILACTFGDKNIVKEGGTADTVRRYLQRVEKEGFFNKSFHYNLSDGILYNGALAPEDIKK